MVKQKTKCVDKRASVKVETASEQTLWHIKQKQIAELGDEYQL